VNLALKINPNLVDSMIYKGLLLRTKAQLAKDEKQRNAYLFEAKLLQEEAVELRKSGKGEFSGAAPLPPPPTLPPATGVTGSVIPPSPPAPVRVGGDIIEPAKVKNVPPVYPPIAIQARVQGIVILECTIDARGNVADARVLRSIPLLDQAAIDAVKQWVYQPTFLNGVPVPVIMTVTVNFGLN
jgi:protein TonB